MPPVRNLVRDPSPAPAGFSNPQHTPAPQHAPAPLAVPSFLSQTPAIPNLDGLPDASVGPYIGVASARSGKWPQMQASGLQEGDVYVVVPNGYVKLAPFKYFLLLGDVFRTRMDSLGNITAATRNLADTSLDEHVTAVVLVFMPDGKLQPAVADFRRTSSPAGIVAVRAAQEASSPEWAQQSPAHAAASAIPYPPARVVFSAVQTRKVSKTTGNVYYTPAVTVTPTTPAEAKAFADAMQDQDVLAGLQQSKDAFDKKVSQLEKLAGGK